MSWFIFGALPVEKLTVKPQLGDTVIAADKGIETVQKFGLVPNEIIGDFDSLGYVPQSERVTKLPVRKDDTDVGYALRYAIENGAKQIYVYGSLGGKIDHTLANLQLCAAAAKQGVRVLLISEKQCVTAICDGTLSFPAASGRISVFCHGEKASGVTLKGLSYELDNAELSGDFPLGVSNEFVGAPSAVTVENGTLLVVWDSGVFPLENKIDP
ncbi:MAG: thiamine diphosphokinase [Clostridia bacterium]|nr:thiamine diphosphokinase [Clostridia bacterium]